MLALEARKPLISSLRERIGGQIEVGADINPEGLETTYEIRVNCKTEPPLWPCEPLADAPRTEGVLAAGYEADEVALNVTILQPGSYFFTVVAVNAVGGAPPRTGSLEIPKPLPPPEIKINKYEREDAGGAEWDQRSSEMAVAEYQAAKKAREEQERLAREAASRAPALIQCVVPSLAGHTLAGARRLLAQAHCKLGRVTYPHRRHALLRVARQTPARGSRLPDGTAVAVRLTR